MPSDAAPLVEPIADGPELLDHRGAARLGRCDPGEAAGRPAGARESDGSPPDIERVPG